MAAFWRIAASLLPHSVVAGLLSLFFFVISGKIEVFFKF